MKSSIIVTFFPKAKQFKEYFNSKLSWKTSDEWLLFYLLHNIIKSTLKTQE